MASEFGHLEIVKFLLKNGSNMEVKDDDERTALFAAALNGHFEIVKFLYGKGAKLEVKTLDGGYTPLIVAAQEGHLEVLKFLIQKGISVNEKTDDNRTALYMGSQFGHYEVVKCLVANGADTGPVRAIAVPSLYQIKGLSISPKISVRSGLIHFQPNPY